jgi:hypothetical protein
MTMTDRRRHDRAPSDDPLFDEIRALLARMAVLSDAPGTSYIPGGAHPAYDRSRNLNGPRARDQDQPLFDKWAARFADPRNQQKLPSLILLANRELAIRLRRKPVPVGEHGQLEDSWERDVRIIDWYQGVPAHEAAIMESANGTHVTAQNIRAVRRRNDRDPEEGYEQTPRERRVMVARELRAQGLSIRKIAREMNVSPGSVQRYLDAPDEERHAA